MTKAPRSVIKLLARHSDWRADEVDEALHREVYAGKSQWHWLLRMLLLALGLGFFASGVLFFFAYNWADISKFGKLTIAGLAVAVPAILALILSLSDLVRKCLVTTSAFLVGPFFGVFGQIYQTGANAYDLFFAWVVFILVWVIAVDFAPLWLLFVVLSNVVINLYAEQVAANWSLGFTFMVLFGFNFLATLTALLRNYLKKEDVSPAWFNKVLAFGAVGYVTAACVHELHDGEFPLTLLYDLLIMLPVLGFFTVYALTRRELYYLALLAVSVAAIVTAFILNELDDGDGSNFLLATLWIIVSVATSVYTLNNLRKKWRHE